MFGGDFPGWTFSLDLAYPIGKSNNEANLARAKIQRMQQERQLASLELSVTAQVRDAARNVKTNAKRVDATRSSRVLAERRLEAEEKKYQAGMTQNFFVLQAQRDLNVARNNELLALVEYAKSVTNYSAVQQTPLIGQSGTVRHDLDCGPCLSRPQSLPSTKRRTSRPPSRPCRWADEIIVVDSRKHRRHVAIARTFTDKVIVRRLARLHRAEEFRRRAGQPRLDLLARCR